MPFALYISASTDHTTPEKPCIVLNVNMDPHPLYCDRNNEGNITKQLLNSIQFVNGSYTVSDHRSVGI